MLRCHWGFANTLHSQPHEEASLGEACVYVAEKPGHPPLCQISGTLLPIHNTVVCITLLNILSQTRKFGSDWNRFFFFFLSNPTVTHNTPLKR